MIIDKIFLDIMERITANHGSKTYINEQELISWPQVFVSAMKASRLITKTHPAKSAICPGCESQCYMPVDILLDRSQAAHAFVTCDKRDDSSRVPIPINCLEQWQASGEGVANLIASLLALDADRIWQSDNFTWEIGLLKGRKHSSYLTLSIESKLQLSLAGHFIALTEVLSFVSGKFKIDQRRLNDLIDNPIAGAGDKETAQKRRERLQEEVNTLKSKGEKAFLKTTAEKEGISIPRLKQILSANK